MNTPNHLPAPQEESNSTDIVPQSHAPEGTVWSKSPGSEAMPIVEGVRLGSLGDGKFKDEHFQQVPDMGITVGVEQASYGFTGISAEALPGFGMGADFRGKPDSWLVGAQMIEIYPNIPTGLEGGMQALPPTEQ